MSAPATRPTAPELDVSEWLNTPAPLTLASLRGRVVMLHAFQMLCPGCVLHGLPQASAAFEHFGSAGLAVIGLHTVFEHHDVMGRSALEAFVHEYRLRFPIAIDRPVDGSPIPASMQGYRLQGTPSLVLIDRDGRIAFRHFGRIDDMRLGSLIGQLLSEDAPAVRGSGVPVGAAAPGEQGCSTDGCGLEAVAR